MNPEIAPVLAEVAAILEKHGMAGIVIVANRSHIDYCVRVEAPWSCARILHDEQGRPGVHIKSQLADYPSRQAQKETLEATIGMFVTLHDVLGDLSSKVAQVLVAVSGQVDFRGKSTREDG